MSPARLWQYLGLPSCRYRLQPGEGAALGDQDPVGAAVGKLDLGGHRMRLVLEVEHRVLAQAVHAAVEHLSVAFDQDRPAGESELNRSMRRSSRGSTLYLTASIRNSRCSSRQLVRVLGG